MRKQFVTTLFELAKKDKDIVLITGDVGFSYLEPFRDNLPNQFINVGLAEQNMIGVATGLALSGKKPWCYSMITFLLFRPYEQIRTACYHNTNIKLIGIAGSAAYSFLGFSHNIVKDEDKQLLDMLPNITHFYPTTAKKVEQTVLGAYNNKGPCYIRV